MAAPGVPGTHRLKRGICKSALVHASQRVILLISCTGRTSNGTGGRMRR